MTRPISRILVPIDFSKPSETAVDYATTLAGRFGASVHLLHVVGDPYIAGPLSAEVYIGAAMSLRDTLVDEAAERLRHVAIQRDRGRFHLTSEIRVGDPARSIRDVAQERRCDLIVMGTHGRTGMAHLLLGSVAEDVVRRAPCPVLTVRSEAETEVRLPERDVFVHEYATTE